ncbi:hypothetical protein Q9966_011390 [Columba livia]|nr:hypothetical protein Q9966_011390 [Columba livia]
MLWILCDINLCERRKRFDKANSTSQESLGLFCLLEMNVRRTCLSSEGIWQLRGHCSCVFHWESDSLLNLPWKGKELLSEDEWSSEPFRALIDAEHLIAMSLEITVRSFNSVFLFSRGLSKSLGLIEGYGGRGKGGLPATLSPEEEEKAKGPHEKYGYNSYLSEKISLDRSIPDYRPTKFIILIPKASLHPVFQAGQVLATFLIHCPKDVLGMSKSGVPMRSILCKELKYGKDLPQISIIFIFVNEALSVILRSVHSAVNHTPAHLLKEIILVDDNSDEEELKAPLEEYVNKRYPGLVKVVRNQKREGLIRARIEGWKAATGQITGFFDAHVEFTAGWAEPVLSRIQENRRRVILPSIDNIKQDNFEVQRYENSAHGYSWELWCMYISPPKDWWDAGDPSLPIRTPAMIGCSFVVHRKFFGEIGLLDPGMDVYGGENIELGIKSKLIKATKSSVVLLHFFCPDREEPLPGFRLLMCHGDGSPALLGDGSPAPLGDGSPALLDDVSPTLHGDGSPPLLDDGSPSILGNGSLSLLAAQPCSLPALSSHTILSEQWHHFPAVFLW